MSVAAPQSEHAPLLRAVVTGAGAAKAKSTLFATLVAVAASISGFCFGYDIGIIDSILAMSSFRLYFKTGVAAPDTSDVVVSDDASHINGWIVSTFLFGCILGSIVVPFVADGLGRKPAILVGAIAFTGGGALQTFSLSLGALYAGRFTGGVGIGILSMVAPLYISESAPAHSRGFLIATQQLMIVIGIFAASCVNSVLFSFGQAAGDWQWRAALSVQVLPGVVLGVCMLALPRSPRWLVGHGRLDEARAVLARLRGLPASADSLQTELLAIQAEVEAEDGKDVLSAAAAHSTWRWLAAYAARYRQLLDREVRPRLALVCWLQFWQQFTGINVILYFAADLFERCGVPADVAATSLVVGNAALLIAGTIPGMILVDRPGVGRRKLLLFGAGGMAAAHVAVCALVAGSAGYDSGTTAGDAFAYGAVAAMMLFTVVFSATWGATVWIVQSEVLPLRARAQGTAIGTLVNWASNALIGKASPLLVERIGAYTYLIFAGCSVAMGVYTYFWVPETAGLALHEMGAAFGSGRVPAAERGEVLPSFQGAAAVAVDGGTPGGVLLAEGSTEERPQPGRVAAESDGAAV